MKSIVFIFEFIGNNYEAIIALSALGLATWQGMEQRRHNRLSVKPHLVFERAVTNHSPQVQINLENSGTGPAIIKNFLIYLDDNIVDLSFNTTWTKIAEELYIKGMWGGGKIYLKGDAIQAGAREKIFEIKTSEQGKDDGHSSDRIHKELDRLDIVVEYESVYGEKFIEKFNKHNK